MRRFGKMWLVKDKNSVVGKLGPEPLEPEFTPEVLAKILDNRKIAIKGLLLDQTLIAGIGNMYADEALYSCPDSSSETGEQPDQGRDKTSA